MAGTFTQILFYAETAANFFKSVSPPTLESLCKQLQNKSQCLSFSHFCLFGREKIGFNLVFARCWGNRYNEIMYLNNAQLSVRSVNVYLHKELH